MPQRWYSLAISSRDEAGLSPSWGRPPKRASSIALSVPIRPPSANGAQSIGRLPAPVGMHRLGMLVS